jgi:hypothetical protein
MCIYGLQYCAVKILGGHVEEILAFIEKKKCEFSQLPFFEYLHDQSISPRQRLAFAPCAAPFVMSFGELNRTVFRDEPTNDPIQKIINKHTYEDDHHWLWFLEDLEKLGFNSSEPLTKLLKLLWSEEASASRRAGYELYRHTVDTTPIQKLIVITVVEATGNVFLGASSQIIRELHSVSRSKKEYKYFGINHLIVDSEHYCLEQGKTSIEDFQLTEEFRQKFLKLVDKIFSVFTLYVDELLTYAKTHRFDTALFEPITQHDQKLKPIGSYLIEAGLIKSEQLQEALKQQELISAPIGHILANQGWVKQETIEYLMEKVILPEQKIAILN